MVDGARKRAERVSAHLASSVPGVEGVCLFGSVARGDEGEGSDIDLLVLGRDRGLTASGLRRSLPRSLRDDRIAVAYHTPETLDRYLVRWPRFGVHLRREGEVLFDRHGWLRDALDCERPVSTLEELRLQLLRLANYDSLDRFGDRFLFPLANMYSIGRTVAFALLAERGIFDFNQQSALEQLARLAPDHAADINAIARLRPFAELVQGHSVGLLPFSFEGSGRNVAAAREAIRRLVALSEHANELTH
jgi:predicted nucleotidyltransferase